MMPPRLPDAVEHVPLARLIPYARNARTHDDDQVAKIAASIVEFGWLNPVLVDDAGNVIAGHGRLLAAQKLGLDAVPVIRASHLTPAQVRAYRLVDNRLAELSGWDDALLSDELHALNGLGFDLGLTGFDQADLDRLMAPLDDGSDTDGAADDDAADDAPTPPREVVSRIGDQWRLGKHRLLCGDSADPEGPRVGVAAARRAGQGLRHRAQGPARNRPLRSPGQDQGGRAMNWQDLGGALVKAGAPIIGRALGGPLGGMIGDAVGGVIADALGVEPTPDAVDHAIKETPADALGAKVSAAEAEAQAKWPALAEIAKADAKALAETHETMRIEAASGDIVQRWWRPVYAFELTLECAICWALAVWDLAFGAGKIAAWAINASGLLSVYWGARFGVLGVYVNGRSREKEAALTGQPAPTAIDSLVKAATQKLHR